MEKTQNLENVKTMKEKKSAQEKSRNFLDLSNFCCFQFQQG